MRNYFDVLRLDRLAHSKYIKNALDEMPAEQLADEDDIVTVLANEQKRAHYRRVHLQYDAIAAVVRNSSEALQNDAHSWEKRVVEFEPERNTIELQNG